MSVKTLLTSEDLWKIVADGNRYELSRGELVPMTPVGFQHSAIVGRLGEFLSRSIAGPVSSACVHAAYTTRAPAFTTISAAPTIEPVGESISGMPGPPLGPT